MGGVLENPPYGIALRCSRAAAVVLVAAALVAGSCSEKSDEPATVIHVRQLPFANPPEHVVDFDGVLRLETAPTVVSIAGNNYCLRGYNGSVPGPTVRVRAAENRQIRIDHVNSFDAPLTGEVEGHVHDFNTTNLHLHGIHAPPERSSDDAYYADNVLIHLGPGESSEHRYDIDEHGKHFEGTDWYHPHVHGTVATQLAGGAAGAFIIEGPVDELPGIVDAEERIFMMQHIPLDVVDPMAPGDVCDSTSLSVRNFDDISFAAPTIINGLWEPVITAPPGQVERWRFLHAGVSAELVMRFVPATKGSCESWDTDPAVALPLTQIAADGVTLPEPFERTDLFLAPGYRVDLSMKLPESEGIWCLVAQRPSEPGLFNEDLINELLAVVRVDAGAETPSATELPTREALMAVAPPTLDCEGAVDGTQEVVLNQQGLCPPLNINCRTFDDSVESPRQLQLETVDAWNIVSEDLNGGHPFHIHINPFTVCNDIPTEPPGPHWRDTVYATGLAIEARSLYQSYTGAFVLHCHKLDHEDQGMMELVEIISGSP